MKKLHRSMHSTAMAAYFVTVVSYDRKNVYEKCPCRRGGSRWQSAALASGPPSWKRTRTWTRGRWRACRTAPSPNLKLAEFFSDISNRCQGRLDLAWAHWSLVVTSVLMPLANRTEHIRHQFIKATVFKLPQMFNQYWCWKNELHLNID